MGLGWEGAVCIPDSASRDRADPARDACLDRGLFSGLLRGFISLLPAIRMQLMWAAVTCSKPAPGEIQAEEPCAGFPWGELG